MQKMTTFEFQAKPGESENLLAFFKRILPETREFPGNKGAQVFRRSEYEFMICVYWKSERDLEKYLEWREERGDFAMLLSFLEIAPNITIYQSVTHT